MNVVSLVTATLVLAGVLSAFGQETAANTPTPLSQPSTEGIPLLPANWMKASAVLLETAYNVHPSSSELPQMSKREVKTLIRNAKTSEDHRKIASYFARQAQIFAKESHEYQAQCVLVAAYPMKYKTKYPSAYDDCRFWEQHFAAKSKEAEAAAKLHEQLAIRLSEGER